MVTKIHLSQNLSKALMYNEKKVEMGLAKCILAQNMILPPEDLTLQMKKSLLHLWSTINANIKKNAVHISISFHPSDFVILKHKLPEIARQFMIMIGFEKQPYLVYRHMDTSIPHAHIVTTNVQYSSETGVDLHYIILKKCIPANRALEKQFNLKPIKLKRQGPTVTFAKPSKIISYGQVPTKQSLDEVIGYMSENYAFTNLNEWSALLQLYRIKTIHLAENSKRAKAGLMYKLLDEQMKPIGVPILASKLQSKPTLQNLDEIFKKNKKKHQAQIKKISLELTFLAGNDLDKKSLSENLSFQGINLVQIKQDSQSTAANVYIDHQNQCALDERNLEQQFHLKNLLMQENKLNNPSIIIHKVKRLRKGKAI